jgi:ectoine hydroxylase-related dioxygenase (phytanoyl-CoA dioxygenase family)
LYKNSSYFNIELSFLKKLKPMDTIKDTFLSEGYVAIPELLTIDEVKELQAIYNQLLSEKEKTKGLRSDLAGNTVVENEKMERITQIMRPSLVEEKLQNHHAYQKALQWAKQLLGDDMDLDFDMLINKAPHTNTETPWHQDAAYWIDLPDKRAASCWIALDNVHEENGCMWFLPVKEQAVLPHQSLPGGGALHCNADTAGAQAIPLPAGGCTFHDGFTLHYSKGNTTNGPRRALILNFRPKQMILLEREQGMDHTGDRKKRS